MGSLKNIYVALNVTKSSNLYVSAYYKDTVSLKVLDEYFSYYAYDLGRYLFINKNGYVLMPLTNSSSDEIIEVKNMKSAKEIIDIYDRDKNLDSNLINYIISFSKSIKEDLPLEPQDEIALAHELIKLYCDKKLYDDGKYLGGNSRKR